MIDNTQVYHMHMKLGERMAKLAKRQAEPPIALTENATETPAKLARRPGRPRRLVRLDGEDLERLHMMVPRSLKLSIQSRAKLAGCTPSEFVRRVLEGKHLRANVLLHGMEEVRELLIAVRGMSGDQTLKDEFLRQGIAALQRLSVAR